MHDTTHRYCGVPQRGSRLTQPTPLCGSAFLPMAASVQRSGFLRRAR
jgi:hypothetical protein